MDSKEIRAARVTLGLTQAQLAKVMGYGATTRISELERGVKGMGPGATRLLKAYLDGYRPKDWPGHRAYLPRVFTVECEWEQKS